MPFVLLIVTPMLNLAACKRRQSESVQEPKPAVPEAGSKTVREEKAPLSDRERLTLAYRQKLPMRQRMKPWAEDAARMLREGDREGFLKLTSVFEDAMGQTEFGIELGKTLDSEERGKVVVWLAEIPDVMTRHRAMTGVLGWALAMDPSNALRLVQKLPPEVLALTEPPLNRGSLEGSMWVRCGLLVVSDAAPDKNRSALLTALSSKPDQMEAYAAGVAAAAQNVVNLGRNTPFVPLLMEIPEDVRRDALCGAMSGLQQMTVEKSAPLSEFLKVMNATGGLDDSVYHDLGRRLDFKALETLSSHIPAEPTPANLALVKGWATQSPPRAVEALKSSRPEYVPAAFSAWVEADSIEASTWLGSQGDGQIITDCTVELCTYLIKSGASEQAADWIAKLPEARRQEIEKMMSK